MFEAIAYVNQGRWMADCPRPYCGNALELELRQPSFYCVARGGGCCGLSCPIVWPGDAEQLFAELGRRPVAQTRNWAPAGHWQAVANNLETTQTVADLREEFAAHDPLSSILEEFTAEYGAVQLGPGIVALGQIKTDVPLLALPSPAPSPGITRGGFGVSGKA